MIDKFGIHCKACGETKNVDFQFGTVCNAQGGWIKIRCNSCGNKLYREEDITIKDGKESGEIDYLDFD